VGIEPTFRFMDRSGIAGGTREVATKLWNGSLPDRNPQELGRELYAAENEGKAEPSGSQGMIGLVYPGINRLGYAHVFGRSCFRRHIETLQDARVARWLESVLPLLPVAPRPPGYNPLGEQQLDPAWIRRLGQSGRDCFDAIRSMNASALGASMNECMLC